MLNAAIITIILRGIPEAFIHMFAMYTFSGAKIDRQKYIISSSILAVIMVLITTLPISYGIHSILIVMAIIGLAVAINHLRIAFCISIAIVNMIIQFLAEGINVLLIQKVFRIDIVKAMATPLSKAVYGIPSLIIFFGVVLIVYKFLERRQMN